MCPRSYVLTVLTSYYEPGFSISAPDVSHAMRNRRESSFDWFMGPGFPAEHIGIFSTTIIDALYTASHIVLGIESNMDFIEFVADSHSKLYCNQYSNPNEITD